jgi:hypothetical protein
VVEQMSALLEHVAECGFSACDPRDLFVAEREDVRDRFAIGQFRQTRTQASFGNATE